MTREELLKKLLSAADALQAGYRASRLLDEVRASLGLDDLTEPSELTKFLGKNMSDLRVVISRLRSGEEEVGP